MDSSPLGVCPQCGNPLENPSLKKGVCQICGHLLNPNSRQSQINALEWEGNYFLRNGNFSKAGEIASHLLVFSRTNSEAFKFEFYESLHSNRIEDALLARYNFLNFSSEENRNDGQIIESVLAEKLYDLIHDSFIRVETMWDFTGFVSEVKENLESANILLKAIPSNQIRINPQAQDWMELSYRECDEFVKCVKEIQKKDRKEFKKIWGDNFQSVLENLLALLKKVVKGLPKRDPAEAYHLKMKKKEEEEREAKKAKRKEKIKNSLILILWIFVGLLIYLCVTG